MNKATPVNILLVDDEPANLLGLEATLESLGENLVRAESGAEALKHVLNTEFAVILLDLQMPMMNGFEVAQLIRTRPQTKSTPIIFITAADPAEASVEQAYALGAVDYLHKPVSPIVLRAKVAAFVDVHRKNAELARIERERHAAALNEKDERLRLILENTKDYAFMVFGLDGRIVEWEGGSQSITGWTAEEAIGQPAAMLFTPEDVAAGRPQTEFVCAKEKGRALDTRWHMRKDGTRFYADGVMMPLKAADGNLRGYAKIFRDATAEKLAGDEVRKGEEARAHLLKEVQAAHDFMIDMFKQAPAFMCLLRGPEHIFEMVNERYLQLVGKRDLIGLPVRQALPEIEGQGFCELLDHVYQTGERIASTDTRVLLQRRPGEPLEERFIDLVYMALRDGDGQITGVLAHGVDQTHRKRAEENLRKVAADLSESDRRKTEFLATLAHELRNPLAPIRSGLALTHLSQDNPVVLAKVHEMMDRQVTQMTRLIDDLLDVARISGGKMTLVKEPVELKPLLSHAVETSLPLIEAAQHELVVDVLEEILIIDADATRIGQVVANLLNNAAKYTPQGGKIILSARKDNEQVVISVTDNGLGIPAESLGDLFTMFNQVGRSIDRSQGGLGIGLSLVRRLVEMHGGTVKVESAGSGCGSTFTVHIPVLKQDTAANAPLDQRAERANSMQASKFNVLVVDDNEDAATMLHMVLQVEGHTTRVAHNGLDGLETAKAFKPEVIFLDIGMPGMNGYEVAAAIRTTRGLENTVLIALTGWGAEADQIQAKNAGFDYHLTKPVSLSTVKATLMDIATSRKSSQNKLRVVK